MIENSRRLERERVLTLLYEAEMKSQTMGELLQSLPVTPEPFVVQTVTGVDTSRAELDALIDANLTNWAPDRIVSIDRNIMRVGAWELQSRPDLSVAVIISEAVELAKRFSTEESGKFVNGVLAAVAASVRPPSD